MARWAAHPLRWAWGVAPEQRPECVSQAIVQWLSQAHINTAAIDPGKPDPGKPDPGKLGQNGTNESFNDKCRDECLNREWFRHRVDANVIIEQWRGHSNEISPHCTVGNLTPWAFIQPVDPHAAGANF